MKQKEKTESKRNIPRLRFPEFQDAGEWEERTLGDVLLGTPQYGLNAASVPFSNDLPAYLRITDISEEGFFLSEKKVSVDYIPKDEDYLFEGDIVFARTGASVGKSYKYRPNDGKLVFAGYLIRIQPDPKKVNSSFLYNHFFTKYYWKWVSVVSSRSGQPGINGSEFSSFLIKFPSLPEQQKIADCLSSLDQIISLESQKLKALQSYKKGLLQQLFPVEGETVPRLRFPEFQDAGDWEERKLGDVADVRDGTHDSPKYCKIGFPLITSKNLLSNGCIDFVNVNLIEMEDYKEINKRSKVNIGDILFGMIGTIGNPVIVQSEGFAIKNVALIKQISVLKNVFLIHLLKSQYVISKFNFLNTGNSQKFIALGQIRNMEIPIPSLPEQQKIADCLSSIDASISTQSQKLEELKLHKKGLLQGLFPEMEE